LNPLKTFANGGKKIENKIAFWCFCGQIPNGEEEIPIKIPQDLRKLSSKSAVTDVQSVEVE